MEDNKVFKSGDWGPIWTMEAIKEYGERGMPYQGMKFCVITEDNYLKIYTTTVNLIYHSFDNILSDIICSDIRIKSIIGPLSEKYGMRYYQDYLDENNVNYQYDIDEKGYCHIYL